MASRYDKRMKTRSILLLALSLSVPSSPAVFAQASRCTPQVHEGWVRLPPAAMPMMAGFGRIRNDCAEPATVVAASSPAFASVELHRTQVVDGVSRMRHVPELRIAPGEAAMLEPGGLHLMLMRPESPVSEGQEIPLVLVLGDGSELHTMLVVRKAAPVDAAHQPGAHHGHHH